MAKDIFHEAVRVALEKEGWIITHDPYPLIHRELGLDYKIDLGAERLLAAERDTVRIAVEPGRRCDQKLCQTIART